MPDGLESRCLSAGSWFLALLNCLLSEAIFAAATWKRLTGAPHYANHLQEWANFAQMHFIDTEHGSWRPLLDVNSRPSCTMWSGKPDIYHAPQAILLPHLPVAESAARAIVNAGNGS